MSLKIVDKFLSGFVSRSELSNIEAEAVNAFKKLTKLEGIIPALESSHAIAYLFKVAKKYTKDDIIIICLSGRGDKDLDIIMNYEEELRWKLWLQV